MEHEGIVLAHEEKFKNMQERIARVEALFDKVWLMFEKEGKIVAKHMEDSTFRILKIDRHDAEICQIQKEIACIKDGHREIRAYGITILLSVLGVGVGLIISMTTAFNSLHRLEILHPISSQYQGVQDVAGKDAAIEK